MQCEKEVHDSHFHYGLWANWTVHWETTKSRFLSMIDPPLEKPEEEEDPMQDDGPATFGEDG